MSAADEFVSRRAAAERDTRVECLQPGDRFRWLRLWFTCERLIPVMGQRKIGVQTGALDKAGKPLVFLFPVGHMVAAECGAA